MSDGVNFDEGELYRSEAIWFLNRSIVVLRPKQQLVLWSNDATGGRAKLTLKEVRKSPTAFLIPAFDLLQDSWDWIQENAETILDVALDEWIQDRSKWPADRTWQTLQKWFEIELIDAPWDLVDEPLSSDMDEDLREVEASGAGLRETVLEVVEQQLAENDPPEVRMTLERLVSAGMSEMEAKGRIAVAAADEIISVLQEHRPYDAKRYRDLLNALR